MTCARSLAAAALAALAGLAAGAAAGCGSSGGDDACGLECAVCEADAECDDGDACDGAEACGDDGTCVAGTALADGAACGEGHACAGGACVVSVCANGELEPGEECDDGNDARLDGCDDACRFEQVYRTYARTLHASPAGSFCAQPTSALGDALNSVALASTNSVTQSQIDQAIVNSMIQLVGLDDASGAADDVLEVRLGDGVLDPSGGAWPDDGSNPIDWRFRFDAISVDGDELYDRIPDVTLGDRGFIGGPGSSTRPIPAFQDVTIRGRLDEADHPTVDGIAADLLTAREIFADGADEGICGNITVDALARTPSESTLAGCVECPGKSHTYIPCPDGIVTDDCNSLLDATVGGCIVLGDCDTTPVLFATQPDVDNDPRGELAGDPANHNKVPLADSAGNVDGFSVYYTFRARRVAITGVAP